MARRRPKSAAHEHRGLIFGLSPNQVVAYNLARARELKGWTQDQTAEALEPYLGVLCSKASLSQAERSVAGRVVRNFSADEIVAFARAFEVPVTWFFMPPPAWAGPGVQTRLDVPDAPALGETVALLVDLVFGDKAQQAMLALRLDAFLGESGTGVLTGAQARITALGRHKVETLVRQSFSGPGSLADQPAVPGQPARGPGGAGQASGGRGGGHRSLRAAPPARSRGGWRDGMGPGSPRRNGGRLFCGGAG
ncbi:MAG TPA: helix-turn-helix transcriptional regulator [Acidimicrobiales bacterium]|nr:helix-turn-helix transcriptional regulator [Acidimicrobiales bacterium]